MNAMLHPRGQALTEFLIVAFALIPLFLLMPVIAKYQDIAHSTQVASRYVAFDAITRNDSTSSWKPEAQLAAEVRRRFFSNSDAPIKTNDTAGNFLAHQNLFWRKPDGESLISDLASDVTISFGEAQGSSHADAFKSVSDKASFVLAEQMELKTRGIYQANVSVKLANLPAGLTGYEPFDAINLAMMRTTSVLIDPWTSKSPNQTDARVGGNPSVFPSGPLKNISSVVDADVSVIDALGGVKGPKLGQLDFWQDVVPADRLK
ncbi:MAG: hypothetical protein ACREX0_00575 [Noviherbaspirillum sp.]